MAANLIAAVLTLAPAAAQDLKLEKAGKLTVPATALLVVFSTDTTMQSTLSQDLQVAHRAASGAATAPLTVTVNVNQELLKPGTSLNDIAAGDPDVAVLLTKAGETPPPLGDTGLDPDQAYRARVAAQSALNQPGTTPFQQVLNQFEPHSPLGTEPDQNCPPGAPCGPAATATARPAPGTAAATGDTQEYLARGHDPFSSNNGSNAGYDTVIVARAVVTGSPGEMTVLAVVPPGQDLHAAKQLVAETIANSLLH